MKITGNIITLNEEENIVECIKSLQNVCDEIIVVDSYSNDNTVALAKQLGAIVIQKKYLGDGPQKNIVQEYSTFDWILSIDADERLDKKMIESINQIKEQETNYNAYSFKRKNYIGKRWIQYCGWYPDICIRLYNKQFTKFKETAGHSSISEKNVQLLDGHIIHYSYKNYHQLLHKTNRFSSRGAKMLQQRGVKVYSFSPPIHFISSFIRKYIIQRGFLDGIDGLTISLTASINSYMKYAKLLEMQKTKTSSESLWEQ